MADRVKFVEDAAFLRSSFSMGVTLDDGVRELIDNAIDARAQSIWVQIVSMPDGFLRLIVMDDGNGIPARIEHDDEPHEGIPFAMAFGSGKNILGRDRVDIGKFGFGLSQTITCLARDSKRGAEVWSRTSGDRGWRMVHYQYDDLVKHDCMLPREKTMPSPNFIPPGDFGTMVIIDIAGSKGQKAGSAQTRLLKHLGRVYRHVLEAGVSISVVSNVRGKVTQKRVLSKDPLALMDDSAEVKAIGKAVEYEVPHFVFDENCPMGERIDPDTGESCEIHFRLSRMPAIEVRRALDLPLTGSVGQTSGGPFIQDEDSVLKRHGIGYGGQGFSLVRAGREIETSKTLGLYTKHYDYSYMHGEVDFPVALDDLFNIQSNKSRYSMDKELAEHLKRHLKPHLDEVFRDHRNAVRHQIELERAQRVEPEAERIAKQAASLLPQPNLTEEEIKAGERRRAELGQAEYESASAEMAKEIDHAKDRINKAMSESDASAVREAETELDVLVERKQEWLDRIEDRWSSSSPGRLLEGSLHSADVYGMQPAGDEAHVTVNKDTEFWDRVYNRVSDDRALRVKLDLMMLSLGYAEFLDSAARAERAPQWGRARDEVSFHIDQFVRTMPQGGES